MLTVNDAVSPETGKTEVLQLSYDAPLLVSTPDRLWGANAILPDSILPRGELPVSSLSNIGHILANAHKSLSEEMGPVSFGHMMMAMFKCSTNRR